MIELIKPFWPAAENVIAGVSTLSGGVSKSPYNRLNLAKHVDDDPRDVDQNRHLLDKHICKIHDLKQPPRWHWLNQTHSTTALNIDTTSSATQTENEAQADAAFTNKKLQVCTVLTADCLPVLLADRKGRAVAAIHAGWRGLSRGVIRNTVHELCAATYPSPEIIKPKDLQAWLGPAIGPQKFEVGTEVKQAFLSTDFSAEANPSLIDEAFMASNNDKFLCDLYQLATLALAACGVTQVYGGGFCTFSQDQDFYSYRRAPVTGRMASFIFLNEC